MSSMNSSVSDIVRKFAKEDWLDFMFAHVNPMLTVKRLKARVVSVSDETADIRRFVLRPNQHWSSFEPGQFVSVRVMIDGVYLERCYSLVSEPRGKEIEIAVKRQPYGKVSNWMHDNLIAGDVIELGDVGGDFTLPAQLPAKLLLIAGGSGITPIFSLLVEALSQRGATDVVVMYYVNTEQDLAFAREMKILEGRYSSFRLKVALASEGKNGSFSQQQIAAECADFHERATYLCGPKGLMDAVKSVWDDLSISDRLTQEVFGFVGVNSGVPVSEMPIVLRRSQQEMLNTKTSILESAEAAGARPVFGCRTGVCKTCSCTKVSGVVRDLITGAIDDQPNTQIRICVSEPLSPVTLDI